MTENNDIRKEKKTKFNLLGFIQHRFTRRSIHVKIFTIIIITAVIINAIGVAVGAVFLTRSVRATMESDLLAAVDIADQFVTKEIELLKHRALYAARDINYLYNSGDTYNLLARVLRNYPMYIGLAVFDQLTLIDSFGTVPVPPDLAFQPFMQAALRGGQAVSTTMYTPDGSLVMYISAPIRDTLVLAAILPGLYFSEIVSQFTIWESGFLFINDADGYVLSNKNVNWVNERVNFIDLAKEDRSYYDIAGMVRRGTLGERGVGVYRIDGERRMSSFRPVSGSEGWFVGVIAPWDESALSDIPVSLLLMSLITFILSAAAATIAAFIIRRPYEEAERLRIAAEAMSESKSIFLATMSHEIRTPMNSILGFSELAMEGEASLKTREFLSKIKTNVQWLIQILNDILDISRVESGKMKIENIPFDIHELLLSCRTLIMPKAVEKGLVLFFYVEPSLGKTPLGDPTRLRQIIVNLLTNAVKYTNTGMIKLNAVLKGMDEKTITMFFEIKDSGIGMNQEQINEIFDPFTRVDKGPSRRYNGTGLGLTITKNIIELMGGKLHVESTPGIGSKFYFDLVFETVDAFDEETLDKKIVFDELEKPSFKGEILLCEDNDMNQQVICEHLTKVGFKTAIADNGKIGYEIVKERKEKGEKQFDLIFMDMHMPVMDGLEASKKIKELDTGIPIVAITANLMLNDREIYKENGMNDCVGKPFTAQELWRCLMKYFTPIHFIDDESGKPGSVKLENDLKQQKQLQKLFIEENSGKYEEIISFMEAGSIETARTLTHELKNNAAQIGKIILRNAAFKVENKLINNKNLVTEEELKILKIELEMVLKEFSI